MGALNPFSCPKGGSDSGCLWQGCPASACGWKGEPGPGSSWEGSWQPSLWTQPRWTSPWWGRDRGPSRERSPANPKFPRPQGTLLLRRQGAECAPILWQSGSGRSHKRRGRPEKARPGVQDLGSKTTVLKQERAPAVISGQAQPTAACITH